MELGRRGLCEGRGNCLKYPKMGWNRTGEGKQRFKRGELGQGVGVLKKRGAGTPLRTMHYLPQI